MGQARVTIGALVQLYQKYGSLPINVRTQKGMHRVEAAACTARNSPVLRLVVGERRLECSPDHLIKAANGRFVKASRLVPGQLLHTIDGLRPIDSVEFLSTKRDLYDIQVATVQEYWANGLCSHNSSVCDILTFATHGQTVRPISKQIDMISKDQDEPASCSITLTDENERELVISRRLAPFKYYGNKAKGVKQYSKVTTSITLDGVTTTGDNENDTKRLASEHIGNFDDYLLLSVLSMDRPELSMVGAFEKPTFKDTLRRLLAIDVFDEYELICNQRINKTEQDLAFIAQNLAKVVDASGDIEETKKDIASLSSSIQSLRRRLDLARQAKEVASMREVLKGTPCSDDLRAKCSLYSAAEGRCKKAPESNDDIKELGELLQQAEKSLNEKNRLLGALQQSSKDREDLTARQNVLELALKNLRRYKEVVGRNGVSLAILKKMLKGLETGTNNIIASITNDFQLKIDYDGDAIVVYIYDSNKQRSNLRPVALGSGMEKLTVEIAFRMALLQMCRVPRLSIFIVDERLSVLDQQSMEEALALFDYMENFFSHIIIITHNLDLKDMVKHVVEVVKQDGVSIIEN